MDFSLINVGIADLKVASGADILRTILGSCVGICLYDASTCTGCLSHIMLPEKKNPSSNDKKYADTAIPLMIEEMLSSGAVLENITAKLVGGARMFKVSPGSIMGEIGENNINRVREELKSRNIKIISEDVGNDYGRTIDFYMQDGSIKIKSLGRKELII